MGLKSTFLIIINSLSSRLRNTSLGRRFGRTSIAVLLRQRGIQIAYLTALFTLSAGIFSTLLEGSDPRFSGTIIITSRAAQNFVEFIINFFTLMLGTGGVYLMYLSGRQTSRYRLANLYLLLGATAVIISILVGLYLLQAKRF